MSKGRTFRSLANELGIQGYNEKVIDKGRMTRDNYFMLLNKTAQMFEYENLPATIPKVALELLLQTEGSCAVWRVPSKYKPVGYGPSFSYDALVTSAEEEGSGYRLFAMPYTLADAPDPYDLPYKVVVTNPGFRPTISETLELNKDCVLVRNDTYMRGVSWIHRKYAALLTEAEISLRSTLICLRDQMTFIAKTEPQRLAVEKYIADREAGVFGSILAPELGSPLEIAQADGRTNSVELAVNGRQAIYAAWYNEIGLNPSFSLKREYTSAQEIDTNTDLLIPAIDDMLHCRELACDAINAMFGTSISVRKSSAWEIKQQQIDAAIEVEQAEADALVTSGEDGGSNDFVQQGEDDASGGSDT